TAADQNSPKVTALSLRIEKAGPSATARMIGEVRQGTEVRLLLELPGRFVAGVDLQASKFEKFTDDRNTDLLEVNENGRLVRRPGFTTNFDDGADAKGDFCTVRFHTPGLPGVGSTKIRVKGNVVALVGKEEKAVEFKNVSLTDVIDFRFGT